MNKKLLIPFILLLSFPLLSQIQIEVDENPGGWNIEVTNSSDQDFDAMIFSATPVHKISPGDLSLPPGQKGKIEVKILDGNSDEPLLLRIISDHKDNPGIIGENALPSYSETKGEIFYFYTPSCSSCRDFLNSEIPRLEAELNRVILIKNIDITTPSGFQLMNRVLNNLGLSENRLPIIVKDTIILAGEDEIREHLEPLLMGELLESPLSDINQTELAISNEGLKILPIFLAGLLDGINPCAFTTLIFLLSWLSLAGRGKKEILITGLLFSAAVYITYYAVGLGAFGALRSSTTLPLISIILKWAMALVLLVLFILNLLDYRKIKRGKIKEITLQLSKERKKKIHSLIRTKVRGAGLIGGSLLLGFLVTIYELGCTGQIYLPTLMYMVKVENKAYHLLALYNLAFILPLMIVFYGAYRGMGSEKLALWFETKVAMVKLASAIFFLVMAGLLIVL